MAYTENNPCMQNVSGKLGDTIVIKQYNGKTVYCKKSRPGGKESPAQKQNRDQFREASAWAKQSLLNPVYAESFSLEAKRLMLRGAYTAALRFKLREIKAASKLGQWSPVLTLKEATEAAARKRKVLSNQDGTPDTQSALTVSSIEVAELRKSVNDMHQTLHENLAAMQKSIQESIAEMNKAMLAVAELVKSATDVQRPAPQREQLKHAIQTSMRPAIASLESVKQSAASMPDELLSAMVLPDISILNEIAHPYPDASGIQPVTIG